MLVTFKVANLNSRANEKAGAVVLCSLANPAELFRIDDYDRTTGEQGIGLIGRGGH